MPIEREGCVKREEGEEEEEEDEEERSEEAARANGRRVEAPILAASMMIRVSSEQDSRPG